MRIASGDSFTYVQIRGRDTLTSTRAKLVDTFNMYTPQYPLGPTLCQVRNKADINKVTLLDKTP